MRPDCPKTPCKKHLPVGRTLQDISQRKRLSTKTGGNLRLCSIKCCTGNPLQGSDMLQLLWPQFEGGNKHACLTQSGRLKRRHRFAISRFCPAQALSHQPLLPLPACYSEPGTQATDCRDLRVGTVKKYPATGRAMGCLKQGGLGL